MDKIWLKQYPPGVPAEVDTGRYASLVALIDESFGKHAQRTACVYMGHAISFARIDAASRCLAAYLQSLGLQVGDRVAVMMPNVPQYLVAVAAILRAGYVVVNVNPLYTPRELAYQLEDSGATTIIVLENFAATLQQVPDTQPRRQVIIARLGDMLGFWKSILVNRVVRHVKKRVPRYRIAGAVGFNMALSRGQSLEFTPVAVGPEHIAVLQYTGGTTGVSKGAVLLHRNLVANVLQCAAWYRPALARVPEEEQLVTVCALPIYHVFGFNTGMMLSIHLGGAIILIVDPRDLPTMFKALRGRRFHSFPAVNTLFHAMAQHADVASVDWRSLVISGAGGMTVRATTAELWLKKTGCAIVEGYGLSETSPLATCNPVDSRAYNGSIGLPIPGTDLKLLDEAGREVPPGSPGEVAIRGPQVMAGYWGRPEETAQAMTEDGFFRSGDIGIVDERGYFKIVDRKKDMILVGGFNVYPNEIEDVVTRMPGISECAAVGVPDTRAGEAVKLVIVRSDPSITKAQVSAYCESSFTGYKRPRHIEFREKLPKTPVGKILRRELRE